VTGGGGGNGGADGAEKNPPMFCLLIQGSGTKKGAQRGACKNRFDIFKEYVCAASIRSKKPPNAKSPEFWTHLSLGLEVTLKNTYPGVKIKNTVLSGFLRRRRLYWRAHVGKLDATVRLVQQFVGLCQVRGADLTNQACPGPDPGSPTS
jgi:hypothetical protein